jgi:hypothetical protein
MNPKNVQIILVIISALSGIIGKRLKPQTLVR